MRPGCRRLWQAAAITLRLLCFVLLLVMFSQKLSDFLRQPLVSETQWVPAPPPAITVCPAQLLADKYMSRLQDDWQSGMNSTEEVLHAGALPLRAAVSECHTVDDAVQCMPERERKEDAPDPDPATAAAAEPPAVWTSRRVPPEGVTCHTLDLAARPELANAELLLTLRLYRAIRHTVNGYYRIFVHASGTIPKSWYGGSTLVSPYNLVLDTTFKELVLEASETETVDLPGQRCQPDRHYDQNQCLLDCRSLAAFAVSNCSVQWGASSDGDWPACVTKSQYEAAVEAWSHARVACRHCLRPCRQRIFTISEHPAMEKHSLAREARLQLRPSPEQPFVRQRIAYTLVDLLVDLGGTFGLLLGYSLMSLADLLAASLAWVERRWQRRDKADAPGTGSAGRDDTAKGQRRAPDSAKSAGPEVVQPGYEPAKFLA